MRSVDNVVREEQECTGCQGFTPSVRVSVDVRSFGRQETEGMVLDPPDVSAYVSVRWDLASGASEPSW